jgi:hypothetical protein
MKQYTAERFRRFAYAEQAELTFEGAPFTQVSPLDQNVAQATWATDATKCDLSAVVASCLCEGSPTFGTSG